MKACVNCEGSRRRLLRPGEEPGAASARSRPPRKAMVPDNYIKRVIQFAKQGYTDIEFPTYDTDWDSRGLPHRLRPELQQLGARHRRVPAAPSRPTATGTSIAPHRRQGHQDAEGPRAVGQDRLRRLGLRRSRHPVPHHHQRLAHLPGRRARSAPPTRARNTCSSTTRPAIWPR